MSNPAGLPYCFSGFTIAAEGNGSLKPRTRREAIRCRRASPFLPLASRSKCPRVALFRPAFTGRQHRRQPCARHGAARVLNPARFLLSFASLHSSFSLTYLRHSVSAQAAYCPDVVGLLLCTAPFIAATIHSHSSVLAHYIHYFQVIKLFLCLSTAGV